MVTNVMRFIVSQRGRKITLQIYFFTLSLFIEMHLTGEIIEKRYFLCDGQAWIIKMSGRVGPEKRLDFDLFWSAYVPKLVCNYR